MQGVCTISLVCGITVRYTEVLVAGYILNIRELVPGKETCGFSVTIP